jgi:predicted esterase
LRTRLIIVHSPEDTMVPVALADKAKQYLADRGIGFKYITYPGGHMVYPGFVELVNGLYP